MTTRWDAIRDMDAEDFAYLVTCDKGNEVRSSCCICQRYLEENCDDRCLEGITEYLKGNVGNVPDMG